MACCHDIGQREERLISFHRRGNYDKCRIRKAGANGLGLSPFMPEAPETSLQTCAIQSFATEFTGAITEVIGSDPPVPAFERADLRANLLHYAHPFMADLPAGLVGCLAPI